MKNVVWTIFIWFFIIVVLMIAMPYIHSIVKHASNANISQNEAITIATKVLSSNVIKGSEKEYNITTTLKSKEGWLITFENSKSVKIQIIVNNDRTAKIVIEN